MKGGRLFRTKGIKEGGERVNNVTRIITELDDDLTVKGLNNTKNINNNLSLLSLRIRSGFTSKD